MSVLHRLRFLGLAVLALCAASHASGLEGVVLDAENKPAAGAVVYLVSTGKSFSALNNRVEMPDAFTRAITDKAGAFKLESDSQPTTLVVRDMAGQLATFESPKSLTLRLPAPGTISGTLKKGPEPIAGQEVEALLLSKNPKVRIRFSTKSSTEGTFQFSRAIPGQYEVITRHDVPQVGCCFRSVVTNDGKISLEPNGTSNIAFGGTDLPLLAGTIRDLDGAPLHGVWVSLRPKQTASEQVWSTVTDREGRYLLGDIPPGDYSMRCFRRLALNTGARTFDVKQEIAILDAPVNGAKQPCFKNVQDLAVDLAPFMPLDTDQAAPAFAGTLTTGAPLTSESLRGKIVVLHAFASWCAPCRRGIAFFDQLQERFPSEKVAVIGVNFDETLADARDFIRESNLKHPVFFEGSMSQSRIGKDYRIAAIPATFVIDASGNLYQQDVFDETLAGVVEELLAKSATPSALTAETSQ